MGSVALPPPGGADAELALAALRDCEDVLAAIKQSNEGKNLLGAEHDVLRVRENSGHGLADRALDIHEVGVGTLDLSLELVHELLLGGVNVNEIDFHFDFDAETLVDDCLFFK